MLALFSFGVWYGEYTTDQTKVGRWWVGESLMFLCKILWLVQVPYTFLNFYTYMMYPACQGFLFPRERDPITADFSGHFYYRYVTRGTNPAMVTENIAIACSRLAAVLPPNRWTVEVVTDNVINLDVERFGRQAREIVVPAHYQTAKGTKYKARALQYAVNASEAASKPGSWIVHLDEETRFEEQLILEVERFAAREERLVAIGQQRYPCIGQGVILYSMYDSIENLVTTLADCIRVGDDYGRFRFQYALRKALFGMHGSYVVIAQSVEAEVGFDWGLEGSITEDTFFALLCMSRGVGFQWMHSFMYEQSPFSVKDFIKQRQRWFNGLWLCALSPTIPEPDRRWLRIFLWFWTLSWINNLTFYAHFAYPTNTPLWMGILGGVSFGFNVGVYIVGFLISFKPSRLGWPKYILYFLLTALGIPVFSSIEAAAALYGLFSPSLDFYIVQKEKTAALTPDFSDDEDADDPSFGKSK
jgi:egghead protein (zeste-white 4 protein)